jgi:hypothetical protein
MSQHTPSARVDAIDRLAAAWQQARLHERRTRRCLEEAVASGDPRAIGEARTRQHAACIWESNTRRRYLRAVELGFAWWTHPELIAREAAAACAPPAAA